MTRILVFTGDGKGKTTAAFGTVLRAAGHGWKCLVVQFIKERTDTGEYAACSHLPDVEIATMGRGFSPGTDSPRFESHRQAAEAALDFAEQALDSGKYDLLVLDEICGAIGLKLVDENRVIELLKKHSPCACIILTGRGATPALMECADTVTDMACKRHALRTGIPAQPGIEF
jgi:cob(I)alamin adenosyltransferase